MYPLVIVLGIAAYRQKTHIVPYILPLVIIGGGISTYHSIIQNSPKSQILPHAAGILLE